MTEVVDGQPITYLARYYPLILTERGLNAWWLIRYINSAYPSGAVCSGSDTLSDLVGPVNVQIP